MVLFPSKFMIHAMTDFDIVNFPFFLDCDVPRARVCSHVEDLTAQIGLSVS